MCLSKAISQIPVPSKADKFFGKPFKRPRIQMHTDLLHPGFRARNFLTSTCNAASSPPRAEPKVQELAKFDAGKQSSATLSQHLRLISKRYAWRVAKTTRGKPDFDNFADITLIVPGGMSRKEKIQIHNMFYMINQIPKQQYCYTINNQISWLTSILSIGLQVCCY